MAFPHEVRRRAVRLAGHVYLRARWSPDNDGELTRLGSDYGGWRVPLNNINANSVVYCIGCGTDVTFDLSLIERTGCTVYALDPMERSAEHCMPIAAHEPRFRFHPWALANHDGTLTMWQPRDPSWISWSSINLHKTDESISVPCRSLPSLMREFGHDHIDLLKLDIEGEEFTVLEAMLRDGIHPCVLAIEYHGSTPAHLRAMRKSLRGLRFAGYRVAGTEIKPNWIVTLVRNEPPHHE